jgi:hypothetical protein
MRMRMLGAPAVFPEPVLEECTKNARDARAFFVWSNGDDLTAVVADVGDDAEAVQRTVRRFIPEFA